MAKAVLILLLILSSFGLTNGLRCFQCAGDNSITSKDDQNCLNPTENKTKVIHEKKDKPCATCRTSITGGDETEPYHVARSCDIYISEVGCNETMCYCKDKDLCTEDFSLSCYTCYYSSNGGRASLYGLNYESNEKCKNVKYPVLTPTCKTRCFESYEKVRNADGSLMESITRGCEPKMHDDPPQAPNYIRCAFDSCNKISLSSVPETVITTTQVITTSTPSSTTEEDSFAPGKLSGLTFIVMTMSTVMLAW